MPFKYEIKQADLKTQYSFANNITAVCGNVLPYCSTVLIPFYRHSVSTLINNNYSFIIKDT